MYLLDKKYRKNMHASVYFCKMKHKDKPETNEIGYRWVVAGNREGRTGDQNRTARLCRERHFSKYTFFSII